MEEKRNDVDHKLLSTQDDPSVIQAAGPRMTFTLFPTDDELPPQYRLVTVREIHDHREALRRAMPGWEIANLADGSVDGLAHGGRTRLERRSDAGHNLATQDPNSTYAKCNMQDLRKDSRVTFAGLGVLPVSLLVLVGVLIFTLK